MKSSVTDWLLEPDNPPVRYLTLKHLLHKSDSDPEVRRARSLPMDYKVTQEILKHAGEFWVDEQGAYKKYKGAYWQLIFLGQFLADGKDPRIAAGAQKILANRSWISKEGGQCLTANILASFTRLGFGDHPVVVEEREALARRTVGDRGIDCNAMGYSLLPQCHMALPKLLLCFSLVPAKKRSAAVNQAIHLLVERLVAREVFVYVPGHQKEWQAVLEKAPHREDLPPGRTVKAWIEQRRDRFLSESGLGAPTPKQGWLKFGFPLHYNSDILEAMYALAEVGTPMSAPLAKPLEAIRDKMTPAGQWIMESTLNGKMWADVEQQGKPSKWLTCFALRVLKHFEDA